MKVSLNHIRYYQQKHRWSPDPAPGGVDTLVEMIGAQLGAVEEVIAHGKRYAGVLIAKVMSLDDHPDADRLHVCKIDDGGVADGVERDDNGHVQVVCGAPNVYVGMMVAWLPPGVSVPSTAGKDPFILETRELRGVMSSGMLASPKELALSDSHEGILEIDDDVAPGTPFDQQYGLVNDYIIDIENKMFTHRPDCFGMLGVAREIAGIQGHIFKSPQWWQADATPPEPSPTAENLSLTVENELPDLVPRFTAITLSNVQVKSSPVWLQVNLSRLGVRPINNVVDITNYLMLLTGQPLHAYDYDKVVAQDAGAEQATLRIRHPRPGETITLLNGKTIEPRAEAIMVASRDALLGVGGVMGGADTEVSDTTTRVILEVATFDMYSVRRTSMAHGLFTDAVTRFNKGQSPLQNMAVLTKATEELQQLAGAQVAGAYIDENHLPTVVRDGGTVHPPVHLSRTFVNARLGFTLDSDHMATLLRNVEFTVDVQGEALTVRAPFWRTDIAIPEDVVEEIGRLYGFDHLPLELPVRDVTPATKNPLLELKSAIRNTLVRAGANEVLSYSFVHASTLQKAEQPTDVAYQLSNALSPALQYYRLSLTPSLLDKVHANIKAGSDQFALFEIGKAHVKGYEDEAGLPKEFERIALVYAAEDKVAAKQHAGAPYYQARTYVLELLRSLGLAEGATFEPLSDSDDVATTYYAPGRAATIRIGDTVIGRIGEYKAAVQKAFKLPDFCAGFELGLGPLLDRAQPHATYTLLPRFPKIEQDICIKVTTDVTYETLSATMRENVQAAYPSQTLLVMSPVDIYQRPDDELYKQITLRFSLANYERTLTDQEVSSLLRQAAEKTCRALDAEIV